MGFGVERNVNVLLLGIDVIYGDWENCKCM